MNEDWQSVTESLPEIGSRVRALVVKELIFKGNVKNGCAEWQYDAQGEHGVYSWSYALKSPILEF